MTLLSLGPRVGSERVEANKAGKVEKTEEYPISQTLVLGA